MSVLKCQGCENELDTDNKNVCSSCQADLEKWIDEQQNELTWQKEEKEEAEFCNCPFCTSFSKENKNVDC